MANALKDAYLSEVKRCNLQFPFSLLGKQFPYDANKYRHDLRTNTMPPTVVLYYPILNAIWHYAHPEDLSSNRPFRLVQKTVRGTSGLETMYISEMGLLDGSSLVVTATKSSVRISHCETDGTRNPILPFPNESDTTLTAIMLTILPLVLELDVKSGGSKLNDAISNIGNIAGASFWTSANDIPDIFKESFYFTDVVFDILKNKFDFDFTPTSSSNAAEVDDVYFSTPTGLSGALVEENLISGWQPKYVQSTGTAQKAVSKNMNIGQAKDHFKAFSADRKWNMMEQMLIPFFPDDYPVMPEVIHIANRICNTQDDVRPVTNIMWRGITSYGKSTGIKQLAAVLNMPLLIITCHPGMELLEFLATCVPTGTCEGIMLDTSKISVPTPKAAVVRSPYFSDAMAHIATLSADDKEALLDATDFFMTAMMDTDMAAELLLGKTISIDANELCALYCSVREELAVAPLHQKIANLEAAGNKETTPDNRPQFKYVVSNYAKALINGYIIEIQEASRIRDSGVLVGLNEYDHAGASISLMDGSMARRHKKAICVITDNVGYASCRPIDPSVLRRQDLIIDSYELSKEMMQDRARRNTGCTDPTILDTCYDLWEKVSEFCAHNSITEGSVSATEYERFVQAVYYDGLDSITVNLNNCVISKATSSIEDQQEIRTTCATLNAAVQV